MIFVSTPRRRQVNGALMESSAGSSAAGVRSSADASAAPSRRICICPRAITILLDQRDRRAGSRQSLSPSAECLRPSPQIALLVDASADCITE
jgi:hypothetical protein